MNTKMWKQSNDASGKGTPIPEKQMRYYVFYPPTKSMTLIDIGENVHVEEIVEYAKRKFGLKVHGSGPSETSIVLSYNGFDLKPRWCISDLSIPSGAIIHCVCQERKAADLYVYCDFDKHTLKLFDSSITIETEIRTIRRKIAEKLGLPLSTFCLETFTGTQRLYDEMRLIDYDIKIHDHVYLKVWRGYEKYIGACVKGFIERFAPDELTRHYQAQVALHIAAFYGHMELASSVLRQGARCDHPVGEPPSRQWSSDTTIDMFPEVLRCPIHIAIEKGHVILVDLFVRNTILCTQIRDPITGSLPYRLALSCSSTAKTKEEKRCYNSIYFYLFNKQYYLKIPLNANGEFITNLLASTGNTNAVHRPSAYHVNVSLPFYCRIISWCEQARKKTWKIFGGQVSTAMQTRRFYPEKGLLGYKVLIDGYNNTFEVPAEQLRLGRSSATLRSEKNDRYLGFNDEEREKIIETKSLMKQFASEERRRFKQAIGAHLHQSRRPTLFITDVSTDLRKNSMITPQEVQNLKAFKPTAAADNSSMTSLLPSSTTTHAIQIENSHMSKGVSPTRQPTPRSTIVKGKDKQALPSVTSPTPSALRSLSILTNRSETPTNNNDKQTVDPIMSSADAYVLSSSRLSRELEQQQAVKRRELFTQIEQSFQQQQQKHQQRSEESTTYSSNQLTISLPTNRSSIVDVDSRLPLPDHPINIGASPIKSRLDLEVHQSTLKSYERYASASTRSTAVNCLQEANHFKRKPWIKQVEISKEMVKHKVQRRIGRADGTNKTSTLLPLRNPTSTTITRHKPNTVKVH